MNPDQKNHLWPMPSLPRGIEGLAVPVFLYALVVVTLLALPTDASARKHPGTSSEFTVEGTNGYSLTVKSERDIVTVVAANQRPLIATLSANGDIRPANRGNVATSTYGTSGSAGDPNVIEADLGALGAISVAFQPSGKTRVTKVDLRDKTTQCVGAERIVRRLGTFVGTIRFQGEGGYTTVDLPSAAGTVGTSLFRNCSTKVSHRSDRAQTSAPRDSVFLMAFSQSAGFFSASTGSPCLSGRSSTCFFANNLEQVTGDVLVVRSAQATAARNSFAFDDALSSATLTPPAPFSGHGSFRSGSGQASSWTGSLQVAFPGITVPLAGLSFKAKLTRSE